MSDDPETEEVMNSVMLREKLRESEQQPAGQPGGEPEIESLGWERAAGKFNGRNAEEWFREVERLRKLINSRPLGKPTESATASETDASVAATDLLERLHHPVKTESTASELEQLARERWSLVPRALHFNIMCGDKVLYEGVTSESQGVILCDHHNASLAKVQELTRKEGAFSVCACGHATIDHRREKDHDECTIGECECDQIRPIKSPAGEATADNEAELEQLWRDTKGINPKTGEMWLTPRMARGAAKTAEAWQSEAQPTSGKQEQLLPERHQGKS
jgi:hypothetical protein